jgi:RNA polymerase subunit RPABC4/transcription elongation factor Spt4
VIADIGTIVVGVVVAAVIYVIVLWLALAFYVMRDAHRRSASPAFHMAARVLGLIPPFLGPLVYLVLRPPRTIEEERTLALEEHALLEPPSDGVVSRPCPTCGREIEQEFIVCPYCRTQFARRCVNCDRSLRLGWSLCPYCATEVGAPPLTRNTR